MPFAFCTREKHPWTEFAESAEDGPTIKLCQEVSLIIAHSRDTDIRSGTVIWAAGMI